MSSRLVLKVAAAAGLVAAVAMPFTLGARADVLPVLSSGSSLTDTVNTATQTVTNTVQGVTDSVTPVVSSVAPPAPAPASDPAPASSPVSTAPALPSVPGVSLPVLGSPSAPSDASDPSANDPATQAPTGTGSANALNIPLLDTCVSCTSNSAGADSSSTDSNATALRILGHDISAGHEEGDNQNGSGNLIALPANPLLSLAIADWVAQTTRNADGSSNASSRAALVDLDLTNPSDGTPVATLAILEAGSDASWSSTASSGNGYTNGVNLNLGNGALVVILLHSEAHSSASGQTASTYVASINGNEILSNTQIPQKLTITIPGIITINLLLTNSADCSAGAAVATVTNLLGMNGEQLGAFEANATGCAAPNSGGNNGGNPGGNNGGNPGGNNGGNPGENNNGGNNTGGVPASSNSNNNGVLGAIVGTPSTGVAIGLLGFILVAAGITAAVSSRMRRNRNN